MVSVPLVDGTDRIGLLELDFDRWDGTLPALLEPVVAVFVMVLITKNRYSDHWVRARRSEPLTAAAEIQWDLLPPLSCATAEVGVGGILEPAYQIGGDSFDYAINGPLLEFAIVDAIGHGMSAVLMSAATVNSLRNARPCRRRPRRLVPAGRSSRSRQFGNSFYVTGQFGSLDVKTGVLSWINAGHTHPCWCATAPSPATELHPIDAARPGRPSRTGGDGIPSTRRSCAVLHRRDHRIEIP